MDTDVGVVRLVRGPEGPRSTRYVPNGGRRDGPDTFHLQIDLQTESVVYAVTSAVAFVHNVDPLDLDPLQRTVDPEALTSLLEPDQGEAGADVEVSFTYEGLRVTVDTAGNLWLQWL